MFAAVRIRVPLPSFSRLPLPEMTPLRVNSVPSTSTVLAPEILIGAVTLLVPVLVARVPPARVIGSATPVTLRRSKVPPVFTVVLAEPDPKAPALVIAKVPALTVVAPV